MKQFDNLQRLGLASVLTAVLAVGLTAANAQSAGDQGNDRGSAPRAAQRPEPRVVYPQKPSTTGTGAAEHGRQSAGPAAREDQDHRNRAAEDRSSDRANDRAADRERSAAGSEPGSSQKAAPSRRSQRNGTAHETTRRSDRNNDKAARQHDRRQGARHERNERRQSADRDRRETTGQSSASDNRRQEQSLRDRNTRPNRNAGSDQGDRRGSVSLSHDQRTRISARLSERIDRMDVRSIPRSRISVSIGATVPRHLHLYDLPPDVVSIYPRFRGNRFVLVEDEIVIIEPGSRRIVAVLPREGATQASRETTGVATREERLRLSPEARRVIHTTVLREPSCHFEQRLDFFLFLPLPRTVQVCEFPRQIVEEVPEVRSYRYAVRGNEVVIVDPDENRVVEVIE